MSGIACGVGSVVGAHADDAVGRFAFAGVEVFGGWRFEQTQATLPHTPDGAAENDGERGTFDGLATVDEAMRMMKLLSATRRP